MGRDGSQVMERELYMAILAEFGRPAILVIYVAAMVGVIVGADLVFFRHLVWGRLIFNIGVVLVFAAFYLRFLRHS
jgi:hypothetical protein